MSVASPLLNLDLSHWAVDISFPSRMDLEYSSLMAWIFAAFCLLVPVEGSN
jgi:hypothetical protein